MKEPKLNISIWNLLRRKESLRAIGYLIRKEIKENWQNFDIVSLDFGSETVASGSLFDEIAKLFDEFPKEEVKRRLQFENIDPWDLKLLAHLAKLRLEKQKNNKK